MISKLDTALLTQTQVLLSKYMGPFTSQTVSDEEWSLLSSGAEFQANRNYKNTDLYRDIKDEDFTKTEGIADFVRIVGRNSTPEIFHSIVEQLIARETTTGADFLRNAVSVARYFLAYEFLNNPAFAEEHFNSARMQAENEQINVRKHLKPLLEMTQAHIQNITMTREEKKLEVEKTMKLLNLPPQATQDQSSELASWRILSRFIRATTGDNEAYFGRTYVNLAQLAKEGLDNVGQKLLDEPEYQFGDLSRYALERLIGHHDESNGAAVSEPSPAPEPQPAAAAAAASTRRGWTPALFANAFEGVVQKVQPGYKFGNFGIFAPIEPNSESASAASSSPLVASSTEVPSASEASALSSSSSEIPSAPERQSEEQSSAFQP